MNKMKTLITFLLVSFFALNTNAQVTKPVIKKSVAQKTGIKTTVVKKIINPVTNTKKPLTMPGLRVKVTTDSGVMIVRLYDKTPLHRDNFIKLASAHFFDSLLFHRIINGFMIQGGDPKSKNAQPNDMLGNGDIGYTIPAEFDTALFHKKGALAAARTNNPEKASSGCQFYIVQGKKITDDELNMIEMQKGIKYSLKKRNLYKSIGGTPFLDMDYTVFGEVESGLNIIDKIASAQKSMYDRPLSNIHMYIEVIK